MRLAFVHQPLGIQPVPATMGSIEVINYELARRLASSYEVFVYSRKGPAQSISEIHEGVRYRRVTTRLDDKFLNAFEARPKLKRLPGLRNPKRPLFASWLAHLEYGLKVARDIAQRQCDWVHIHNFSQIVRIVRIFNPKVKIALHMHCEWLTQLQASTIRRRLKKCDLIIGVSEFITRKIRASFQEVAGRCHTLLNAVDAEAFAPDESRQPNGRAPRVLFVGRIWPDKGPHVLLEAFKKVVETRPDVQLELAGWKSGPPPEFIFSMTDDQKVLDLAPLYQGNYFEYLQGILPPHLWRQVSVEDALPHPELAKHYRMSDILVAPSVWNDPCPLVTFEAMATGLPVVATRSGGIPEVVKDGETGLLTERGDVAGLAEAISTLLENAELRKAMGRAARKRALELFSWEKMAQQLSILYQGS